MSLTFPAKRDTLLTSPTNNGDKMNKITTEQVEMWLGSDCKRSEILEILADLANGDYDQKVLRTDIITTTQQ